MKIGTLLATRTVCAVAALCAGVGAAADFADDFQSALRLHSEGKHADACAGFEALAAKAPTAGSKSDSLRYAVLSAIQLRQFGKAEQLLAQIPREGTRKLCQMQLLLAQKRLQELVDRFQNEDLAEWPDVHVYDAFLARGQAFQRTRQYRRALADLAQAEQYATTPGKRAYVLNVSGYTLLESGDDRQALAVFRRMKAISELKGYGIINDAILSAARILAKQGKYPEALREMDDVVPAKSGYWHARPLTVHAEILAAAGRKTEAIRNYTRALQDAPDDLRKGIQTALDQLR
jgi:tetratricopeptide (TPR) repeat protein